MKVRKERSGIKAGRSRTSVGMKGWNHSGMFGKDGMNLFYDYLRHEVHIRCLTALAARCEWMKGQAGAPAAH